MDEWGYYEMSGLGHPDILTPNIDEMARTGMRFTHAFAGAPVCAPTRAALMTGKHMGHASIRANSGGDPIRDDEVTIAEMLKQRGYATGGFGKWGAGARGTSGVPEKQGFDTFFGYYDQVHAHTFYPEYLVRNSVEVPLEGNTGSFTEGAQFSHTLIFDEAMKFLDENRDAPFFLYLPFTPPHGRWGFPKDDPSWPLFKDKPWTGGQRTKDGAKIYAAMIHMVDRQIGEIKSALRKYGIEKDTVFIVSGDNGGQAYFPDKDHPRGFFAPNVDPVTGVQFRKGKGSLYDGGLRIPMLVEWPGRIKAGTVSRHELYFPDFMTTIAEITGTSAPEYDGISFLPELLGQEQRKHEFLYWEFLNQTAVRAGRWKAIQPGKDKPWELYEIDKDVSETNDIAAERPVTLRRLMKLAEQSHEPIRKGETYDRTLLEKDRAAGRGN